MNTPRVTLYFTTLIFALTSPAPAQEDDGESIFASETNKSLTLSDGGGGTIYVQIVVRTPDQGVSYYGGEIAAEKKVATFGASATSDAGKEVDVPITIRLGDGTATVIADFPDALPASKDPSGTYKKLDAKQHLAFMQAGYNEADKALNARWATLKKTLPADLMADLTKRQRAWIEHKEYMSQWDAGDIFANSPKYWESGWEMTASRTGFLDTMMGNDAPPGIAGVYVDEYGGLTNIVDSGGGNYRFQIHVVRGPTYHLGVITKSVIIRDGKGRFVDTDNEAFWDDKPCTIDFAFTGNRLEIKAENSAYYHGARADFGGTYFKIKGEPKFLEE